MQVYARLPEYNTDTKELVFPNTNEIPNLWIRYDPLKLYTIEDVNRFKTLQNDIFRLMEEIKLYIENSPIIGKAIIYYNYEERRVKDAAKKLCCPEVLFVFGFIIKTALGESELSLSVKKGWTAQFWCTQGVADSVMKEVIQKFTWKSTIFLRVEKHCRFDHLVRRAHEKNYSHGQHAFAFNVPESEYLDVVFRS